MNMNLDKEGKKKQLKIRVGLNFVTGWVAGCSQGVWSRVQQPFLTQLLAQAHSGKEMSEILGSLTPAWGISVKFWAPRVHLTQPQISWASESEPVKGDLCICLPLLLCFANKFKK